MLSDTNTIIALFTISNSSFSTDFPTSVATSPLNLTMGSNHGVNSSTFTLQVRNKESEKQGMVNVIFYKPSHLRINLNDLETLRKANTIGTILLIMLPYVK